MMNRRNYWMSKPASLVLVAGLAGCGVATTAHPPVAGSETRAPLDDEKAPRERLAMANPTPSDPKPAAAAAGDAGSAAAAADLVPVPKTDEEWRRILTPQQYEVTRRKGTEHAFTGEYWNSKKKGVYRCVCCNQPLFVSETKFDSGTGWPSFYKPIDKKYVAEKNDDGWLYRRTEVLCSRCDAHLGHVFADAPQTPTGMRYCINSVSLKLDEKQPAAESDAKD